MANSNTGPLSDLRVLDISEGLAGPFCAKLLGDLGADVVKVEPPGRGDPTRDDPAYAGLGYSPSFFAVNTSKRSLELDIASERGRALVLELVRTHDVVVSSRTLGELGGMGLGFEALSEANPATIVVSVTGFGSEGPYAGWQSTALITNAIGGWAITCGLAEREPILAGGNMSEFVAGAYAAAATIAAVAQRDDDGLGQAIDVSAMEATLTAALLPTLVYEFVGAIPNRDGTRSTGPSWIFECKDGRYVGANSLTPAQWTGVCQMLGAYDLVDDPAYASPAARAAVEKDLRKRFEPWFKERTAMQAFYEAQEWRLPFGLVPSMAELLEFDQHKARQFWLDLPHPARPDERVKYPRLPFRMSGTPSDPTPPPVLGSDTRSVLVDLLGLDDAEAEQLVAAGVAGPLKGGA